jgi:hypothetical protein
MPNGSAAVAAIRGGWRRGGYSAGQLIVGYRNGRQRLRLARWWHFGCRWQLAGSPAAAKTACFQKVTMTRKRVTIENIWCQTVLKGPFKHSLKSCRALF